MKNHDVCEQLFTCCLRRWFPSRKVNHWQKRSSKKQKHWAQLRRPRGPEIESWFGVEAGTDPAIENDWSFLPFMALSDGAHA